MGKDASYTKKAIEKAHLNKITGLKIANRKTKHKRRRNKLDTSNRQ